MTAKCRPIPIILLAMAAWAGVLLPAMSAQPSPGTFTEESQAAPAGANSTAGERPQPTIIAAAPSAYESTPEESLTAWVAKVNGEPICLALFMRRLAANRASAYLHFGDRRDPTPGEEFWTTPRQGETPAAWLKQRTLDECVRTQVELALGKQHNLVPDTSYAVFLRALDRENERRRGALARGEPIYGPQQYGEDDFWLYVINNLRLALERALGEGELKPSDQTLRGFYESVKDEYFHRGDRVKVWVIQIATRERPGGAAEGDAPEGEARARILEAKRLLEAGAPFEEVAAEYSDGREYREQVVDPESRSDPRRRGAEMRAQAMRLAEGEVSDVFQEMSASVAGPHPSADMVYYVIKCVGRESLGYHPFEEVEEGVTRIYLRRLYENLVDERVRSADLVVNQAELDRIQIK